MNTPSGAFKQLVAISALTHRQEVMRNFSFTRPAAASLSGGEILMQANCYPVRLASVSCAISLPERASQQILPLAETNAVKYCSICVMDATQARGISTNGPAARSRISAVCW